MRLVTWNCARGPLAKKLAALEGLNPDVAVVTEAPAPPEPDDRVLWFPTGEGRSDLGTQVRAYGDFGLARHDRVPGLPACVNPVRVLGPVEFNLLAVWTWAAPTYLSALTNGIEAYASIFESPTVVAGDFNGNPAVDRPRQRATWSGAFSRINELGSVSAYHRFTGAPYGAEPSATHHHRRNPEHRFHIDFCFVPAIWCNDDLEVTVACDEPWVSIGDHFPVVVDLSRAAKRSDQASESEGT